MKLPLATFSRVCVLTAAVEAVGFAAAHEAKAQEVVVYPDAAYLAVAEPVYFNGLPHYWYRDRWYYRSHGGWAWYHEGEPAYLHDYRYRHWQGGFYHPEYRYHAGYWHRR